MFMILFTGGHPPLVSCPVELRNFVFREIRVRVDIADEPIERTNQPVYTTEEGSFTFRIRDTTIDNFADAFQAWDADDYEKRPLLVTVDLFGTAERHFFTV